MSKKILALALVLCMVATLSFSTLSVSAAIPESPWAALDLEAFAAGTDANWVKGNNGIAVETLGGKTGITSKTLGGTTVYTFDPEFIGDAEKITTTKRNWGWYKSTNTITSADTDSYIVEFKHTMGEGAYDLGHNALYFYPRTSSISNYLDNRFAILMRRNSKGVVQIGLKTANQGATQTGNTWISVANTDIDLMDANIRIVDSFTNNFIKVYMTNTEGVYQHVGTYTLDLTNNAVTLTTSTGTLTASGYANTISATSTTPIFLSNEYSGLVSDIVVSYPYTGPQGVSVSHEPGTYIYDTFELDFTPLDEDGMVYYTVDGTDPIENEDGRMEYYEGDFIDLNPDGLDLPFEATVNVVEELNGEYSDVQKYTYTLISSDGSFGVNYDDVAAGEDPNWKSYQTMVATTYSDESTYNDAFSISAINNWAHLGSTFGIPGVAESAITTFNVKNVVKYSEDLRCRGIYLSVKTTTNNDMTSPTTPYIIIGAETVGVKMATSWSNTCVERVPFGVDLDLSDGNSHTVKLVDYINGDAYLYIDEMFVAKIVINGANMTLTNACGESVARNTDVTLQYASDNIKSNICLVHNTATISEIDVTYPAPEEPVLTSATIDAEDAELFTDFEPFDIDVTSDAETVYYTVDGSFPSLESEEVTDGKITVPTSAEPGNVVVRVRPYDNGEWGIGDTVTYNVIAPAEEYSYDFNDETYLEKWIRTIGAGGTTIFTQTEEGKLTPGSGWSMINYASNIKSGFTNTIAFDLQDLDANTESTTDDWLPLGVALRHINPSNWFNESSSGPNTGIYLMFNQQRLGIRLNNASYNSQSGYGFVDVDADFTNETRVIIKDAIANNLIGVYTQDIAGETDPVLIAYLTIEMVDSVPYVSLYSTKEDTTPVEDVPFGTNKYSTTHFRPVFMTYSTEGGYSIDNLTITINNVETETIDTPVSTPVITEVETGSDYYKFVEIDASAAGGTEIYYTLDGSEPSKENGTLYEEGSYVLITNNSTLSAIAYDAKYGNVSEVTTADYTVADFEYTQYPFDPAAKLAGTDNTWNSGSNNNNARPAYYVNADGSFTFDGRNSGDYTGGVGSIWTANSLTAASNGVVITEFDAKNIGNNKNHRTLFIGLRHGSNGAVSMTDNNLFYIKLYENQIGFKDEGWGVVGNSYIETGADFNVNSSEYQHYTVIDDKINNVVKVLGNGHLLGTYTFSTTTKPNDTLTLTTPAGNTLTKTYTTSIQVAGQVYIGQAYTDLTLKNLIVYSGTIVPEYAITFDAGEFGTLNGDATLNVPKYEAVTNVPSVTTDATFEGWSQDGGITVLTSDEVAAIVPTGAMTFTAVYSGISIEKFELVPSVVGTSPAFIDSFPLSDIFTEDYSVYYTLNGEEPTVENATLWDGKYIKLEKSATLKAFATANEDSTEVVTVDITVNDDEYWYDILDNKAIVENYGDTKQSTTDGKAFYHSSNRAKDSEGNWYAKTLALNEDGSLHVDGVNYGGGTGVSTTYPTGGRWDSDIEKAKTMVYNFDVRNADDYANNITLASMYKAMYIGIRIPSDAGYGALVANKNPQMVLANGRVGFKFGTWGAANSITWAENVPENLSDISGSEWVKITVVDDRTSNIIKLFADDVLLATYTIDGANFTMTDVAGKSYTVTYSTEIDADGYFYIGSANYSFDLNNFNISAGTVIPEYNVTFNVGENGSTNDTIAYSYAKYDMITDVPEVTANPYYTFNGWTIGEGTKVYTDLDIIKMNATSDLEFIANYTLNPVNADITIESITAEKGKTAKTVLKITSEATLSGYVTIAYDDAVLTFVNTSSDENVIDNGDGTITVNIGESTEYSLVFAINEHTVGEVFNLQICDYEISGSEDEPLNIVTNDATITAGVLMGDANQNGKIDVYDAVIILQSIAGIVTLEGDALVAADVYAGEAEGVTVEDATVILKYIARIIATF